jgi:hypothetical protein
VETENTFKPSIGNESLHQDSNDKGVRIVYFDTDHYLVVEKIRERLAVSKQAAQKFNVEIFNLRKLNELEARKKYQIQISNSFVALEKLNDSEDINRFWENTENIKTSQRHSSFV